MRNRWFPGRIADYVPNTQVKQLKAQNIDIVRRLDFGVEEELEEEEEQAETAQKQYHVRPIEIDVLSVCLKSWQQSLLTRANNTSLNGPWSSSTLSYRLPLISTVNL